MVIDEFSDRRVQVDHEGIRYIKKMIRGAILGKNDKIKTIEQKIHHHHDMDLVDKTFVAKIYPATCKMPFRKSLGSKTTCTSTGW